MEYKIAIRIVDHSTHKKTLFAVCKTGNRATDLYNLAKQETRKVIGSSSHVSILPWNSEF